MNLVDFREMLDRLRMTPAASLLQRADAIRAALTRCLIVTIVGFCVAMGFASDLFRLLKAPLLDSFPAGAASTLHFTGPLEVLMCYMHAAFLAGVLVTAPYCFLEVWRLLAPAWGPGARQAVPLYGFVSLLLFYGGVVFGQLAIMPTTLKFLIGMGQGIAAPVITFEDYYSLVAFMLLGFGVAFEIPVVLVVLERLGVIQAATLERNRGPIIIGILVIAAIVTPSPDPFSQLALGVPMYLLFELALLLMRWRSRRDVSTGTR